MQGVTVVDHPLVQHKLTLIRDKSRSTKTFRELLKEIGMLLCYEVTRDLPLEHTRARNLADARPRRQRQQVAGHIEGAGAQRTPVRGLVRAGRAGVGIRQQIRQPAREGLIEPEERIRPLAKDGLG